MKNNLTFLLRQFNILGMVLLIFYQYCQSQIDPIFHEENVNLTSPFQAVRKMSKDLYAVKYNDLHRKEGNEINLLLQNGSVFTRMLHKSGAINFNSEATRYLNELKEYVLKDYPKAASTIKIYITFNPALNAFATINKNVYFNVGLLARVKNEAQLAYIMCHELMHIIENHSVEHYRKIKKQVETVGKSDVARKANQTELSKHNMSQLHEFEADKYGIHLFLTTGYEPKHAYEALKLLKEADDELEQKKISKEILHVTEERYNAILTAVQKKEIGKDVIFESSKTVEIDLNGGDNKEPTKSEDNNESTHPSIDERLIEIDKLIKENEKTHRGKASFVVNEQTFNRLKVASLNMVNTSQNQSSDFISAYLINAAKIAEGQTVNIKDIEHLSYSIFGLIHDRKYKMRYNFSKHMSHIDSVFTLFYRQNTLIDLTLWGLEVLDSHRQTNNAKVIDDYMKRIIKMVKNEKGMKDALEDYIKRFGDDSFIDNSLKFSDIDFKISMSNFLSNAEKKNFNKQEKNNQKKSGKIAFIDMNNIVVDVSRVSAGLNFKKSDKLDDINYDVFGQLYQKNSEDLIVMIPNGKNYTGKEYTHYSAVLNWISERIYFDQTPYKSLYAEQIEEFKKENNVRYIMLGVNLMLNQRSGISLKRMAGIGLNPLYLPLAVATKIIEKTRNYQLTIIFDLDNGELVFWDKRTSIEPMNEAFIYNTYDDILNTFRK